MVPIDGEARKALKSYLNLRPAGGDELWKTDDGQPMSIYSLKIMIARLKKRAGVVSGGGAHRLRHYFATRYLEGGTLHPGHGLEVLKVHRCPEGTGYASGV